MRSMMRSLLPFLVFLASPVRPRCRLPLPKGGIPWFSCADARGIATPSQPYSGVKALSTIVCMIGNLRGGHAAWDSTVQQLVRPLHADLALLASDADVAHHASIASPLVRAARHIWIHNESTYWDETIDELLEGKGWRGNVSLPVTTNWAAPTGLWGGVATLAYLSPVGIYRRPVGIYLAFGAGRGTLRAESFVALEPLCWLFG